MYTCHPSIHPQVNDFTITMDIKLKNDLPRDGLSLFQTALIHMEENPRTGRKKLKQSDGECVINTEGGVGVFGTFGDVATARVDKDIWKRVVICVKCANEKQGVVRTWIDSIPCATVRHEEIIKDGRFAIDPEQLFLFSSSKVSFISCKFPFVSLFHFLTLHHDF
jgi:hypothetical protein